MYTIRKTEVYENGEPTGVKAVFTKKELKYQFGWSKYMLQKNLTEIAHMIYEKTPDGKWDKTKKVFSSNEICAIYNWFGLP